MYPNCKERVMLITSFTQNWKLRMRKTVLITGGAGFIGSHLAEGCALLDYKVQVVDSFLPNLYSADLKRRNWQELAPLSNIEFFEIDLCQDELSSLVNNADIIINCAAMPGLMPSWNQFSTYLNSNVLALSRILDQVSSNSQQKIIQISTSSVYGRVAKGDETSPTIPYSPYGVTKLAAEHLIRVVSEQKKLNFNVLRLFSVYGPRQRPDMAYSIIINKLLANEKISIFGDGSATRSNTYVSDVVNGIIGAIEGAKAGESYNISGGEEFSLNSVIGILESLTNRVALIENLPVRPGDQSATRGDFSKAAKDFNFHPAVGLSEGLGKQIQWVKNQVNSN